MRSSGRAGPQKLPVVFTREEVRAVLGSLRVEAWLMASLLYGSGLRLMECVRLRVKDLDFERLQLTVREGKGGKDRVTMLPGPLVEPLRRQLGRARALHEADVREGLGRVYLPYALARKYPNAEREWCWQYVFPASRRSADPRGGWVSKRLPPVPARRVNLDLLPGGGAKALAAPSQPPEPVLAARTGGRVGASLTRGLTVAVPTNTLC